MKHLEDVAYVVLLPVLVPLLIVIVWVAVIVIATRQTYWWIRGNSARPMRRGGRRRRSWRAWWSWIRGGVLPRLQPGMAMDARAAEAPQES
jgi:hypothetical protein